MRVLTIPALSQAPTRRLDGGAGQGQPAGQARGQGHEQPTRQARGQPAGQARGQGHKQPTRQARGQPAGQARGQARGQRAPARRAGNQPGRERQRRVEPFEADRGEPEVGVEPTTSGLQDRCSDQMSYSGGDSQPTATSTGRERVGIYEAAPNIEPPDQEPPAPRRPPTKPPRTPNPPTGNHPPHDDHPPNHPEHQTPRPGTTRPTTTTHQTTPNTKLPDREPPAPRRPLSWVRDSAQFSAGSV